SAAALECSTGASEDSTAVSARFAAASALCSAVCAVFSSPNMRGREVRRSDSIFGSIRGPISVIKVARTAPRLPRPIRGNRYALGNDGQTRLCHSKAAFPIVFRIQSDAGSLFDDHIFVNDRSINLRVSPDVYL